MEKCVLSIARLGSSLKIALIVNQNFDWFEMFKLQLDSISTWSIRRFQINFLHRRTHFRAIISSIGLAPFLESLRSKMFSTKMLSRKLGYDRDIFAEMKTAARLSRLSLKRRGLFPPCVRRMLFSFQFNSFLPCSNIYCDVCRLWIASYLNERITKFLDINHGERIALERSLSSFGW